MRVPNSGEEIARSVAHHTKIFWESALPDAAMRKYYAKEENLGSSFWTMVIELAIIRAAQDFGCGAKTEPETNPLGGKRCDVAWLSRPPMPNQRHQGIRPEEV